MDDNLKALALEVVKARTRHRQANEAVARLERVGSDTELADAVIESQRALTAVVRAENALAQAVRKEQQPGPAHTALGLSDYDRSQMGLPPRSQQ